MLSLRGYKTKQKLLWKTHQNWCRIFIKACLTEYILTWSTKVGILGRGCRLLSVVTGPFAGLEKRYLGQNKNTKNAVNSKWGLKRSWVNISPAHPISWWPCIVRFYFIVYCLFSIFEPTCAHCTVGSYASLSVRLSVCLWLDKKSWTIIHISKSVTPRVMIKKVNPVKYEFSAICLLTNRDNTLEKKQVGSRQRQVAFFSFTSVYIISLLAMIWCVRRMTVRLFG